MSQIDLSAIPDSLTDAEARKLLEQVAPRARKISDDIVRNNTKADQGLAQMKSLNAKAMEHFGTDDVQAIKKEQDERKRINAQRVRDYVESIETAAAKLAAVAQSAPVPG